MGLTQQEREFAEILSDPVKFAKFHFGWEAYDYQEAIMRNPSTRKVLRWGRRSGKSDLLAIFVIWYCFTHGNNPDDPNTRPAVCLIAAPYENQVKLIFRRIRELLSKSPEIQQSIDQNTKHPEYISFLNGAVIAGFTSGTKSGAGGASLRGQRANWLIVDEMDYMSEQDIDSIFAIASDKNNPDPIGIVISSTPTGKRSKFYEFCVEAQGTAAEVDPGIYKGNIWTESYSPSTNNPGWKKDAEANEREWRALLGEDGYVREILAQFGPETAGVFNKEFIDRAKKSYEYTKKPKRAEVRVMGVDWDVVQAPPTLCCLEFIPDEVNVSGQKGMFKVINRMSLPRTEFTLDNAVNEIVKWNHLYQPDYIYVDRGFGQYQVERLHILGKAAENYKEPAWKMDQRVVGVSFSENREVKDPGTGEMIKKPVKPWMITQTQIMLERDRLIVNKEDDELWKQMENYRVEKVGVDGRPTYTSTNEHSVDALALCILAIVDKFPELTKLVQKFEPTRIMAIAPPLRTPTVSISRGKTVKEKEEEYFINKSVKANNTQTWFKVDDLRQTVARNIDNDTVKMFVNSPFKPRGSGRSRPSSRGSF